MTDRPVSVLLDQNVPRPVLDWLRSIRPAWSISHVYEVGLGGRPDRDVFLWAQAAGAIVITFDEDFADARSIAWGAHHGIIRLRVWPTTVERTQEALRRLLEAVPEEELRGALVIVGNTGIRIRRPRSAT